MPNVINKVEFSGQTLIDLTSDTVSESDVVAGKTFHKSSGVVSTGTMPDNGSVVQTIPAGGSYIIPEGYHDGTGVVSSDVPLLKKVNVKGKGYSNNHFYSTVLDTGEDPVPCTYAVGLYVHGNYTGYLEFQGSNDNSSWTTLKSKEISASGNNSNVVLVTDLNVVGYRYYRVHAYSNSSSGANAIGAMVCCDI